MLWEDKLKEWEQGLVLKYPKKIKSRFFYETSCVKKGLKNEYHEEFIINKDLDHLKTQDIDTYSEFIKKSKNNYVTSFYNLGGDSILIIPIPKKGKTFTTIKDFIDNASITQQKNFWKYTTLTIKNILKKRNYIYVSTHGLGISYFHLRLDTKPKYYQTKKFK